MRQEIRSGKTYSRTLKLKVRRLYLIDGLSPKEISEKTDIPPQAVTNMANKHGWAAQRREAGIKASAQAEDQARAAISEALESVATRTEELVERGLDLAEHTADERDAKGFAMAAKGVQSFHAVWRLARGVDAKTGASAGRGQALAVVFVDVGEVQPPEAINVTPQAPEIAFDFYESQQGEIPAQDEPS